MDKMKIRGMKINGLLTREVTDKFAVEDGDSG